MARTSSNDALSGFIAAIKKKVKERADASINHTLKTVVSDVSRETMKDHIQKDFYDKYTPKGYERRGAFGGLIDDNNIVTEVDKTSITIANITPPAPSIFGTPITSKDPTLLTKWIDDGLIDVDIFAPVSLTDQQLVEHFSKPSYFEETFRELVGLGVIEDMVVENLRKDFANGMKFRKKK